MATANPLPQKHEHLWLDDGNVVLATDTLMFRVHKTVLSFHSTVFKDMFDLPLHNLSQVNGGRSCGGGYLMDDTFEGLPLVQLHGDDGNDVAHLLRAIYERGYYNRDDDTTPLEKITALLTLSAKYDVLTVRTDVLKQLSRSYPSTLEEYEMLDDIDEKDAILFGQARKDVHIPLLRAASVTAQSQTDIQLILPSLLFACARLNWYKRYREEMFTLDSSTLRVLLDGEAHISLNFCHVLSVVLDETSPPDGCPYPSSIGHCNTARRSPHSGAMTRYLSTCWIPRNKGDKVVDTFFEERCSVCRAHIIKSLDEKKADIWELIPLSFGFGSWTSLREASQIILN